MRKPKPKPDEWDDIISIDDDREKALAFMSSDEIIMLMEQDVERAMDELTYHVDRERRFWRAWAIIATGALLGLLVGAVILGWQV